MTAVARTKKPAAKPARAANEPASKADIYESIYNAIVEHRLQPGTKLTEEKIASLFSVSRTQVRHVLERLAVEQVVTLVPNRGHFVARPTAGEAHDVLSVRRTVEPDIVARLIAQIEAGKAPGAVARLRELVKREQAANARGERRMAVRLSGEFHVLLAELSGSFIYQRIMRELTPLTCLAILTFEVPIAAACPNDEHSRLIDAIEAGNAKAAGNIMREHLHHIEHALHLDVANETRNVDLADVLFG